MAFLLGCEKIQVDFPTKTVFDGVSLGVNEGDRIGIVGRNGDGKSTLLRVLAGELQPDEGRVLRNGNVRVGMLGQYDALDPASTVGEAVVGTLPEYEWAASARIREIIASLTGDIAWDAQVGTLSGGQRRRVDLARLLIGSWDILALDEPTNHLDIRAINWLAQHLKNRWRAGQGCLLVVTHDRWFLDEVCLQMWEVHDRRVSPFEGGFSAYIQQRVERDRRAAVAEERRQNALRRELAWLSRGARARATKPKFHVEAAQALIADVPPLRNELELKRMAISRLGKQVVELKGVTMRFSGHAPLLSDADWLVGPGDRFGIVGANGAGKTTLLKLAQGVLKPTSGHVKIGKTVQFGVLSQHLTNLDKFKGDRVREVIGRYSRRVMLDGKEQTPAQLLEKLGFSKADLNEPVDDLSGGQRRRLALMLILLDEPNVLILDEPGNDMDTDMLAAIESLLDSWPGTLLLVTHDRYLMERVTDHQYAILGVKIRHLPRGVQEYLELADEGALEAGAAGATAAAVAPAAGSAAKPSVADAAKPGYGAASKATPGAALKQGANTKPSISAGEANKLRKQLRSLEGKTETLHGKIEAAQGEMAAADPTDFQALGVLQAEIDGYQAQVEELELQWLEVAEQLES